MSVNIPESVFQKYYDVIDSTITNIFGIDCDLIFVETIEEVANTFNNIPSNKSLNAHRQNTGDYTRENKVYREVEKRETIRLKVYWNRKDWVKVGGEIVAPNTAIQTIFFATDLDKIMRAKYLVVHQGIADKREYRFVKSGEPWPMGLRQNRYFGCFWERAT